MTGEKFMPQLHLKQSGFAKDCKRIKKFRKTGNLKQLYWNGLHKACLAHDAAYSDSKYLAKRTISDKILKNRAYEIARNCKYDGYQRALASMVYKFFDKKIETGVSINEKIAEELHKPVIKKLQKKN